MFRFQYIAQSIKGLELAEQQSPVLAMKRLQELVQTKTGEHRNLNDLQFVLSQSTHGRLAFTVRIKNEIYTTRADGKGYSVITARVLPDLKNVLNIKLSGCRYPLVRVRVEELLRSWLMQIVNAKGEYLEDYHEIQR